jgi:hypothetical protein
MYALGWLLTVGGLLACPATQLEQEPVPFALATVGLAVVLASLAAERPSPTAVGTGSAGALVYGVLSPIAPAVAAGLLLAVTMANRAVRARGPLLGAAVLVTAAVAGTGAALLAQAYRGEATAVRLVAVGVGALIAMGPWVIPVDSPTAFRLRCAARRCTGSARIALLRAAVLCRTLDGLALDMPRDEGKRIDRAWAHLLELARARVDAEGTRVDALDTRLRTQARALTRLVRALRKRDALQDSLALDAGRDVAFESEGLETESTVLGLLAEVDETRGGDASTTPYAHQ